MSILRPQSVQTVSVCDTVDRFHCVTREVTQGVLACDRQYAYRRRYDLTFISGE